MLVSVVWLLIRIRVWLCARIVIKVILFIYSFYSFFPIPFIVLFVSNTCLECQVIAGCSVARGTESFASQNIDCSMVGGIEYFGSQDIDCSVVGGAEYFGGAFLAGFAYCHPSPLCALSNSYKWSNVVPMSVSL